MTARPHPLSKQADEKQGIVFDWPYINRHVFANNYCFVSRIFGRFYTCSSNKWFYISSCHHNCFRTIACEFMGRHMYTLV